MRAVGRSGSKEAWWPLERRRGTKEVRSYVNLEGGVAELRVGGDSGDSGGVCCLGKHS